MTINEQHYLTHTDIEDYDYYEVMLEIRNLIGSNELTEVLVSWSPDEAPEIYNKERIDNIFELEFNE